MGNEIRQLKLDSTKKANRLEQLANLKSVEMDKMKMLGARLPEKEKQVKQLKPNKKELEKIEQLVKDAEVEFGAAEADALSAKESVDQINAQIIEIGKGR